MSYLLVNPEIKRNKKSKKNKKEKHEKRARKDKRGKPDKRPRSPTPDPSSKRHQSSSNDLVRLEFVFSESNRHNNDFVGEARGDNGRSTRNVGIDEDQNR
jgi:hypothetical protein